jgi:hypothetical protein
VLDYERLMAPLDAANPCGPDLRDDPEFREIEDAPGGFANQKAPELQAQIARCDAFLLRTKDQAPALVAMQAAVRIGDFALANDALRLVKGFAVAYWDDFHPGPAEEMAIGRINELSALARPAALMLPIGRAAMAALPPPSATSFTAAMVAQACTPTPEWSSDDESALSAQVENGQISATLARAVRPNREGGRQLRAIMRSLSADVRAADEAADIGDDDTGLDEDTRRRLALGLRGQVAEARWALSAMSDLLYEINDIYDSRTGDSPSVGPVLSLIRTIVTDADRFLDIFPAEEAAAAVDEGALAAAGAASVETPAGATAAPAPRAFVASVPQTRADVGAALDSIRRFYLEREPGSPVPLILERIRSWVEMDFLELMAEIAPGGMSEARDLLALKEE